MKKLLLFSMVMLSACVAFATPVTIDNFSQGVVDLTLTTQGNVEDTQTGLNPNDTAGGGRTVYLSRSDTTENVEVSLNNQDFANQLRFAAEPDVSGAFTLSYGVYGSGGNFTVDLSNNGELNPRFGVEVTFSDTTGDMQLVLQDANTQTMTLTRSFADLSTADQQIYWYNTDILAENPALDLTQITGVQLQVSNMDAGADMVMNFMGMTHDVPEPGTMAGMGIGVLVFALRRYLQRA